MNDKTSFTDEERRLNSWKAEKTKEKTATSELGMKFVFEMYAGGGKIDAIDVIDAIYGLKLNPTQSLVKTYTKVDKRGEKFFTGDEFAQIYKALRENKDEGGFHDFVECLKNLDIKENGTMKLSDLSHMLKTLGEAVSEREVDSVMEECCFEEEDDDGYVPYLPFLCRLCDEPVPRGYKPAKQYFTSGW